MQRMPVAVRAIGAVLVAAGLLACEAAHAQDEVPPPAHAPAWLEARTDALRVRDGLLRELSTMRRLRAAQAALEEWNEARREVGSTSRTLRPALCGEPELERWCLLLPATFGKLEDGS